MLRLKSSLASPPKSFNDLGEIPNQPMTRIEGIPQIVNSCEKLETLKRLVDSGGLPQFLVSVQSVFNAEAWAPF